MVYYRVKEKYDGRPLYISGTPHPSGYYVVANELLTEAEMKKLNCPPVYVEKVEIKKSNTFVLFGARFEVKEGSV